MVNILVTGKNGYIATSFVDYINKNYNQNFSVEAISLRNDDWRTLDFSKYDAVLHFVGIAHVDVGKVSKEKQQEYYAINVDLTYDIAKKAKKDNVKYFYYSSSSIIFGKKSFQNIQYEITKNTIPIPDNFYGDSKLKAEDKIKEVYSNGDYGIIRFPMVYGKGCKGNFRALMKIAKKIPIFPDIKNKKSAIYIDNLCEFIKVVIENKLTGYFYPQNEEYFCTSEVVKLINREYVNRNEAKRMVFLNCFNFAIRIFTNLSGYIKKAFGDFYYDKEISDIGVNYNVVKFEDSIKRSV